MTATLGRGVGGVLGSALALAFIGLQVALYVGGISYRKDCVRADGSVAESWSFTWAAPIPYLFRPSEPGCVVHTGTRVALNAVGVATFAGLSDEVCVVGVTDSALVAGKGTDDHRVHL